MNTSRITADNIPSATRQTKLLSVLESPALQDIASLAARLLLAAMFVLAAFDKVTGYQGYLKFMASAGVPGSLLPLVIATEAVFGIMVIIGWQTRIAALALAGFTLSASFLFHFQLDNQMQYLLFTKNIAVVGGFLALFVAGAGRFSVDGRKG